MASRGDKPLELPAILMPDESRVSFAGTISISKMTVTIHKNPRRRGDDPLFIGVCSTPLVQFYRHKDMLTLMRGSSYLFDNAALSSGLGSRGDNADNPAAWETLTVKLDSLHSCDVAVDALLARQAEEVFAPPFPMKEMPTPSTTYRSSRASSRHGDENSSRRSHSRGHSRGHSQGHSRRDSATSSVDSYNRHNQFKSIRSDTMAEEENASKNGRNQSSHSTSSKPVSTHISERSARHESASRTNGTRGPTPQESSTDASSATHSSRLPSRRENDDATSTHSSRLPSRRENDPAASSARYTASESIRSSQRVASRRNDVEATPSSRYGGGTAEQTPSSARRETRSAAAADPAATPNTVESASNGRHRSSSSSAKRRERRPVDPIEREFRAEEEKPRARTGSSRRHRTPTSAATPTTADATPASSSQRRSPRRVDSNGRHNHRARAASTPGEDTYMAYSNSVTPRSTTLSSRQRSEQDQFFRMIQKMQHHRLHFMTYLHKEMVHQAFQAEEAKLKAAAAAKTRSASSRHASSARRRTGSAAGDSPRSARHQPRDRSNSAAEESSRLREIEARMAGVESLHREAEREREAAARLRREYEWKLDELAARGGGGGGGTVHSRDPSEFNSFGQSPHRRGSTVLGNGQMVLVPENGANRAAVYSSPGGGGGGQLMAYRGQEEPDMGIAIVDRYIFGDEWHRLYPSQEVDIRFNAQIDVCLALKLPRERVIITNLVVDQPGLRVTAEISHDHNRLPRDVVERRINGSPFRFLQRMYDMRDLFDPQGSVVAGALPGGAAPGGGSSYAIRSSNGYSGAAHGGALVPVGSSSSRRRGSSAGPGRHGPRGYGGGDRSTDLYSDEPMDVEARRRALADRQERRARDAKEKLQQRKKKLAHEVRKQIRDQLEQLQEDEENSRRRVKLAEVTARQRLFKDLRRNQKTTLASSMEGLEEAEAVARATIEVGAARQWQVLVGAHRRQAHVATVLDSEHQRRRAIAEQEAYARVTLNDTMNPKLRPRDGDSRRKERLAQYNAALAEEALHDLVSDERAARAALMTDAMTEWLDILYVAPSGRTHSREPSVSGPTSLRQLLAEVAADEAEDRRQMVEEEARRRGLYRGERLAQAEAIDRDRIEGEALADRGAILDAMLQHNRTVLERRVSDREAIATLVNEEQFYRSTILADEQDEFEVIAELFAEGLKDVLARVAEEEPEDDLWTPRRRQTNARQAKPFHYMTFSPEDMDFPPSAILAIEGILGCSINKNLEVTSISRPLPKTEDEELQFQAGDMILDVAGHSLHSLSHLREVLSSRTMQIQEEAKEEFPDVPEDQLTTAPALQRYIDVLCEHHNFLVQVLRGCDIFQIIVKS